jgi:peptidoglycan/xylan/chitin deacetylase (PgdA/CDA1 family)
MRRRQFIERLGLGGAAAALGSAAMHGADVMGWVEVPPKGSKWASTVAPRPVRGSARTWWSAEPAIGQRLALTFDDGPTEQFTARVLDLLAAASVPATFFVIGALAEWHPDLIRRAHDAGHEIANHSYDHVSAAVTDAESVRAAVLRGSDVIEKLTGARPRWFRPPRGEITSATLLAVREAGLDLALWSVNRGDAPDDDTAGVARHLQGAPHPGAVIDLHDGIGRSSWIGSPDEQLITRRRAEVAALPAVLPRWKAGGYTLSTLSDLISAG